MPNDSSETRIFSGSAPAEAFDKYAITCLINIKVTIGSESIGLMNVRETDAVFRGERTGARGVGSTAIIELTARV